MMHGDDKDVWDTEVKGVSLNVQSHTMTLDFQVMNMLRADVVLGREWLHSLGSTLKRSYEHNTIAIEDHGVHVLLIGDGDVPPSPIICSTERYLHKHDLIKEMFFCYNLSPFMSPGASSVNSCLDDSLSTSSTPHITNDDNSRNSMSHQLQ